MKNWVEETVSSTQFFCNVRALWPDGMCKKQRGRTFVVCPRCLMTVIACF